MLKTNCQATVHPIPLQYLPFLHPQNLPPAAGVVSVAGMRVSQVTWGLCRVLQLWDKGTLRRHEYYVGKRASLPSPLSYKILSFFISPLSWTHLMPQGSIRSDLQSWTWGPAPPMTAPQSAQPGISLRGPRLSPPHPAGGLRRAPRGCFTLSCEETLT